MINPTGKKLEKLLFGMFDDAIQGVDRYNHNGCLWLIFTDEMRWVVEYTKTQTLWYNYYFFEQEMEMVGLDCVEDKDLIQKWFESRFLNMSEVQFADYIGRPHRNVYDTIQNGVKETIRHRFLEPHWVEDTIQNGVKQNELSKRDFFPEDMFQNGVKGSTSLSASRKPQVEQTIKNGVKKTISGDDDYDYPVIDTIQNGVKHIENLPTNNPTRIDDTIQNGVKNTYSDKIPHEYDWSDQFTEEIEDTIQNGVKNTLSNVHPYPKEVKDIVQNGVKNTENFKHERIYSVDDTIQNGVKETTPSGYLGSIEMKGKLVHQIESPKQNNEVEDTIQNGVKETFKSESTKSISLRRAIQNGVKHCEDGDWLDGDERFEDIIQNGEKK